MPYRDIVARAIELGVNAFDTSPYYGPSEILLGTALNELMNPVPSASNPNPAPLPRSSFTVITKAGRIGSEEFDYSPAHVRYSVLRSLQRLHTSYLDLVYMHDTEFVSPEEVVVAVRELRRLRDEEGLVRYVGISGFPVDVLCNLALKVYTETGEPLDAVLSYGHFTVQSRMLALSAVETTMGSNASRLSKLKQAGVDVVLNASILGMGLLTTRGIPEDPESTGPDGGNPLAKWHPSPPGLRRACKELAGIAKAAGEHLESVAIRWSLEEWARAGAAAGVSMTSPVPKSHAPQRVGVTVCGVSTKMELEETVKEWREVEAGLQTMIEESVYSSPRQEKILKLVRDEMWPALGEWKDYVWASPDPGFVNKRRPEDMGVVPDDDVLSSHELKRVAR